MWNLKRGLDIVTWDRYLYYILNQEAALFFRAEM
jgi:hypothetical protein